MSHEFGIRKKKICSYTKANPSEFNQILLSRRGGSRNFEMRGVRKQILFVVCSIRR